MNTTTHRALTYDVALAVLRNKEDARVVAAFSGFPDQVEDVSIVGIGTHIVGRNLAALTHFQVPTGPGVFRGYSWALDKSAGIDLPDRDVEIRTAGWNEIVSGSRFQHPVAVLIADLQGRASLAADEITYPTAATMAGWVARHHLRHRWREAAGSVCHWVQDASVWHHRQGWLLRGHSAYEGRLDDVYPEQRSGIAPIVGAGRREAVERKDDGSFFIRRLVERTALAAPRPIRPRTALRLAVRATAAALEWFRTERT